MMRLKPMYQRADNQDGKIDKEQFKRFASALCDVFSKDWGKVQAQFESCVKFLPAIPPEAFRPMAQIAADTWEGWPRNMVRAIKDAFYRWKADEKIERVVTECEYCNSVGFFSGGKRAEAKPGLDVWYWHTWRCSNCANWRGIIGDKVPIAYPLEIKSIGFVVKTFSRPQSESELKYRDISQLVAQSGQRTNEKTDRPEIQRYKDDIPF